MNMENIINNKMRRTIFILMLATLIASIALLSITGFAFVDFIRGPVMLPSISEGTSGKYMSVDVLAVVDYYAEADGGSTRYTAAMSDGKIITLILPERYFGSAEAMIEETFAWLNARSDGISQYMRITGSVGPLESVARAKLDEWFEDNLEDLLKNHVIPDDDDRIVYVAFKVDHYGDMSYVWVYTLTFLATFLFAFAIVCCWILVNGIIVKKPKDEPVGDGEDEEGDKDEENDKDEEGDKDDKDGQGEEGNEESDDAAGDAADDAESGE